MKPPKSSSELLDMYYNELRSHLLEVAATIDRLERAGLRQDPAGTARVSELLAAASVINGGKPARAKRFLEALSVK